MNMFSVARLGPIYIFRGWKRGENAGLSNITKLKALYYFLVINVCIIEDHSPAAQL